MADKRRKRGIVVTGDVTIDWYEIQQGPKQHAGEHGDSNWRRYPAVARTCRPGGALLLAEALAAACDKQLDAPVLTGKYDLEQITPDQVLHSFTALHRRKVTIDKNDQLIWQVLKYAGFAGPNTGAPACVTSKSSCLSYPTDARDAELVVVDDAGNGYRTNSDLLPKDVPNDALVVVKAHAPLQQGGVWEWIAALPRPERVVVICSIADLRALDGVDISKGLSWEKTALQFAYAIRMSPALYQLRTCANLVVRLGDEAAMVYRYNDNQRTTLVYDPVAGEGDTTTRYGDFMGRGTVFAAGLAASINRNGPVPLEDAVAFGLECARKAIMGGYRFEGRSVSYPWDDIFGGGNDLKSTWRTLHRVPVPRTTDPQRPDPGFWSILDQKTSRTRLEVAESIVRTGSHPVLEQVPILTCGAFQTLDRSEIERFSGVRSLMQEYIAQNETQPLCIAVFGAPGAGKSFGVKQIAKFVSRKTGVDIEPHTENLSQYRDQHDLITAFHRTRDVALSGNLPLVFFDEFDSSVDGRKLFWLKSFLAPMQDGEFLQGETLYHIGKAIFVFAGGTCASFDEFQKYQFDAPDVARNAKLPDFISRLKGYVDIHGPDPVDQDDDAYVIRRALVLRSMFERGRRGRTASLFEPNSHVLSIDPCVLRALLRIPNYRHGNRSLESIIKMSRLHGQREFNQDALPPMDQLRIHVDSRAFEYLLGRDAITDSTRLASNRDHPESTDFCALENDTIHGLARRFHEEFVRARKLKGEKLNVPENYDELPLDKKRSNIGAAEDIPRKLRAIGCAARRLRPGEFPCTPLITEQEVETLARLEHDRWMQEQRLQNWTYGKTRDAITKRTPNMVPYERLDESTREYDRESVRAIPRVLAQTGFEIYRTVEREEIDPELIETFARIIHDEYCRERRNEGDTPQSNPSLVDFDKLPPDLQHANRDNARTIPDKLLAIGYDIRRVLPHEKATAPSLSDRHIETMARLEHDRWCWEKRLQGWFLGKKKNADKKVTPYLKSYDVLPEKVKNYDRQTVRLIPRLLQRAGYTVVKTWPGA